MIAAPILSHFITIRSDNLKNSRPVVAVNTTRNEYLVVLQEEINPSTLALYGQRVSSAGLLLGAVVPIGYRPASGSRNRRWFIRRLWTNICSFTGMGRPIPKSRPFVWIGTEQ